MRIEYSSIALKKQFLVVSCGEDRHIEVAHGGFIRNFIF